MTGVSHAQPELDRKRLEIIKEAVPGTSRIAFLSSASASHPVSAEQRQGLDDAGRLLGVRIDHVDLGDLAQLDTTLAAMARARVQAVLVQDSAVFAARVDQVAALALKHRLATISQAPRFAERGGLLQYGADVNAMFRRSATLVDKVLRGARPAELPVELPTNVELIVNLRTAKAIGITLPPATLTRASRVIE